MLPKQPNQSLIDGINCLQNVIARGRPMGVRELGREMDLDPTRVHRLLRTLAHLGLTQQNSKGKYGPGPGIHALAAQSLYASHFFQVAINPLEKLKKEFPHTIAMGVLWNKIVSYFYHAKPDTSISRAIGSFGVWDAAESGIGIAALSTFKDAELREIFKDHEMPYYENGLKDLIQKVKSARKNGYAVGNTDPATKKRTLAKRLESNPIVAIGISGVFTDDEMPELVGRLNETVHEVDKEASSYEKEPAENISRIRI